MRKLKFENFELWNKIPNNCCILSDGSIIVTEYIGKRDGQIIVIGQKFLKKEGIKNYPINSMSMNICIVDKLSNFEVFSPNNIIRKACLFIHNNINYVIPLLHY